MHGNMRHLYERLRVLDAVLNDLEESQEQVELARLTIIRLQSRIVQLRLRVRRLRNPYFRQRMVRFQTRTGQESIPQQTEQHGR
ncbi:hypothetical protein Poli38472_003936 [Pythium oligandrum]|uniref:Uncharacterized protein n=1 Tax=Pythium oligandrum TaxID=41045 RepID=A0A8K1CM53_PYTOL|nr:hypothetical protein Poli38472_003936 [Pythium oligandrum]|eukprot:TMW66171.1 hypothetical protein Poli38472_003936 [Pythium oligandrum]